MDHPENPRAHIRALLGESTYRLLFAATADAVCLSAPDGQVVDANAAALELLGCDRENLDELNLRRQAARPSHWDQLCQRLESEGEVRDQRLEMRTRAGRSMDCLVSASLLRPEGGQLLGYQLVLRDVGILGYQSVVRDRTERRRAETALLHKAEELARSNAALAEKERLLTAFQRIGQLTLGSLDMERILDRLAQQLVEAGIFRSLMVALVDARAHSVEVVRSFMCQTDAEGAVIPGSVIEPTQNLKGLRYDLDDANITAEVARTGILQVVDSWDQRFDRRVDNPEDFPAKVSYFIPVKRGDQVLSVLATGSDPRDKEEMLHRIETMQPLLNEVGIALEHARLYQSLEQALSEVEELKNRLQSENTYLQDEIKTEHNFEEIVSQSPLFAQVLEKVEQVAPTDATVLILGETGTGKELLARAVHSASARSQRPLVKVNCAALPEALIESELFGHEKGAFTGAHARQIGRFELADGGTLFLDEIGELPLDLQTRLLRALQEGEFERLGGSRTLRVDVRVIAATNRDLAREVAGGRFREDLYYRLNVFPIHSPPLRQRPEDIPALAQHFARKYGRKEGRGEVPLSTAAVESLVTYHWPGNVRELENIIERALILSRGGPIQAAHLHLPENAPPPAPPEPAPAAPREREADSERALILRALEKARWNRRQAARDLGMPYATLRYKILRLRID